MRYQKLVRALVRFMARDDGPTSVEYAVLLALIIAVCIGAVTTLGTNASTAFAGASTATATGTAKLAGNWTGNGGDSLSFSGNGGTFTADGGTVTGSFKSAGGNNYTWSDNYGASGTATLNGNTMKMTNTGNGATESFTKN